MFNSKIFLIITLIILIHHFYKHQYDNLSSFDKFIQLKDIDNHETWALFSFGIAIGIYLNKSFDK